MIPCEMCISKAICISRSINKRVSCSILFKWLNKMGFTPYNKKIKEILTMFNLNINLKNNNDKLYINHFQREVYIIYEKTFN